VISHFKLARTALDYSERTRFFRAIREHDVTLPSVFNTNVFENVWGLENCQLAQ
jgi:hypothetical protein